MAIFPRALQALSMTGAACMLLACTSTPANSGGASGEHTLAQGQQVAISPATRLSFDNVNDSRCRKDVVCVWAGKIIYNFTLHGAVEEKFSLSEGTPAFSSTKHNGVRVALADQAAPPVPGAADPAPAYTVRLTVSKDAN
jgi:hypothetical protein